MLKVFLFLDRVNNGGSVQAEFTTVPAHKIYQIHLYVGAYNSHSNS